MAAVPDFLKSNVKFAYGGVGLPFAALDIKNILDADNKFKAILKTMKDLVLIRVSMVGTFAAIGAAVKALVKDTGSLDAALKRLSEVQHFQRIFTPLVGGAKAARKEIADLIQFAAHTPFKFEGVAQAAATLKTSTRGQFEGEPALKKIGDAAATSGNSIEDSAKAVGIFYEALHNGEPINQSVEALRQMGLISTLAATNLDRLAESGGDATAMAGQLTSALSESRGGMKEFANDLEAVATAREKAVEGAQVAFGAPFTEKEIQNTKNYTEAIVALTPAIASAGNVLSQFVGGVEEATSSFVKWVAKSGLGATAIQVLTTGLVALAVAFTAIGVVAIPGFIALIATMMISVEAAIAGMVAWGISMGIAATAMTALGTVLTIVANIAAGAAIAAPFIAAGVAVLALGFAIQSAINHTKNFNKALAEEMAAHAEAIRNINAHIAAIQNLADKYQAVSLAVQQQMKDQKALNDLLAEREKLRETAKEVGTPQAIVAEEKLKENEKKIEQERRKIAIDRKARQQAERTPAIAGPEREALIQLQTRRQLLLEEQRLEQQISEQPGRAPELQRERAGVLAQRAAQGRAGLEANERIALRRSDLSAGRGEVEATLNSDRQQLADLAGQKGKKEEKKRIKDRINANQAGLDKIDAEILAAGLEGGETAVGLETRAQQLQHAINAKVAKERGDKQAAEREEALAGGAVAGPTTGADILALQKRAGFQRQLEAQAPEAEVESRRKIVQSQEEERGRFITELQTHIERAIVMAAREGTPGQKELLTDLNRFVTTFEEMRKIFPDDRKAAAVAMEKVGTEIMNFPAEALKPVADSLTRVGGGGGVGGPTGDPRLMAQQRLATLQDTANGYLQKIEQNTKKGAQPPPAPGTPGVPSAVTGETPVPAIEGGRTAGVGESQEAVNQVEANRIAAANQPVSEAAEAPAGLIGEAAVASRTTGLEQTKLTGGFGEPARAAAQAVQDIMHPHIISSGAALVGQVNAGLDQLDAKLPTIPEDAVPVTSPIPSAAPTPDAMPLGQTNQLLSNIVTQSKQSNEHLGVVAGNSADQGKSF